MSLLHEKRGIVKEIMLVVQYPDSSIKVGQLNAEGVESIIFNNDAIIDHIGKESQSALEQWNSGDWRNNPSVLVVADKNRYGNCGWYCKHAGHRTDKVGDLEIVKHDEKLSKSDSIKKQIRKLEIELKNLE